MGIAGDGTTSFLLASGFATIPPQPRSSYVPECPGGQTMVSCPNIEKEQEPTCDEPDKLINLPPSKSSGGCVARCMCDVWAVQEEGDYKKDPDDRRTIFFGQFCIPYEGCPIDDDPDVALCDLAKKIDVYTAPLPPHTPLLPSLHSNRNCRKYCVVRVLYS